MNALFAFTAMAATIYFFGHVLPETQPFWLCILLGGLVASIIDDVYRHASRAAAARRAARRAAKRP